jgi:ABC-type amino acid transport substrate-binding protein
VPIAFVFPLLGAFVPLLFIQFISWFYKVHLDFWDQVELILVGIPYFFSPTDAVEILLNLMHLPEDSINMYINIFIFRQAFATAISCMSIFSFTAIALSFLLGAHEFQWKKVISSIIIIVSILATLLVGLKFGLEYLTANTYHGDDIVSNAELPRDANGKRLDEIVTTKIYLSAPEINNLSNDSSSNEDPLKSIKLRNVLRVGYNPNCMPFAFFNNKGNLVGYDIEMAYDLARFLNVSQLEFIPVTGDTLSEYINSGTCDIVMSSVVVNADRLSNLTFSDSYINTHLAFVIKDERKLEFSNLEDVNRMTHLKIAVLNSTSLVQVAARLFPKAMLIKINTLEDFFKKESADALITTAEEGYSMTLLHPFYSVSIFEPSNTFQILYAYPVAKENSESFVLSLNYWLKMQDKYGDLNRKYDYWVMGNQAKEVRPRWSIIRNILHWIE